MFRLAATALCIILFLTGCGPDQEVFKPDKDDSRLPRYSEKGNQVGGALLNNIAWKTDYAVFFPGPDHDVFFMANTPTGDTLQIKLIGNINEGPNKNSRVVLRFTIQNFPLIGINNVDKLNNLKFTLDGIRNYAIVEDRDSVLHSSTKYYTNGTGELYIKKVKIQKNLTIVNQGYSYHPAIISGTFHFKINQPNAALEVQKGRFDFNFYDDNLAL